MTRGLHDTAGWCGHTAGHTQDTVQGSVAAGVDETGDTVGSLPVAGPIAEDGDSIVHDTDTVHGGHALACQQTQE